MNRLSAEPTLGTMHSSTTFAPALARIGSERDLLSRRQKRRQKTGSPHTGSGRRTVPPHKPPHSDFRCRSSDCCVGISYYSTQFHPFRAVRILNIACKANRILFLASLRE